MFPLLRHIVSPFCPHARSYVVHVALAQERTLCGNSWSVNLCFNTVWHTFDLLGCRMRWSTTQERVRLNAANAARVPLEVQLSFRWNPCPDMFCPPLVTRKTTRRSLIVPTVTSSFNWEEVGLRSCSVGDRTLVLSGVGSRRCERSEGERHSHRTEAGQEQSGRGRRRCPRRSIEGNGFDVFIVSVQGVCSLSPQMSSACASC